MVFGYLLGGMVKEAGAQMQAEKERSHASELEKHKMLFDMAYQRLQTQGNDMTPEERASLMKIMDDAYPKGKGMFGALANFVPHIIPHVTPSDRVRPPAPGAGVQTSGQAPPESVMAPSTIPQPAGQESAIPPMPERPGAINPRMTGEQPTAVPPMPQMPTNTAGMSFNEAHRARQVEEINNSSMSDAEKQAAVGKIYGILPYETAELKAHPASQGLKFLNNQPFVIRKADGSQQFIWHTNQSPMIQTPQGPIPYVPEPGDSQIAKSASGKTALKQDENGVWQQIDMSGPTPIVTSTGVKGKTSAPRTVTLEMDDGKGGSIKKVLTTEEALKTTKEQGGFQGPAAQMTRNRIVAARNSLVMGYEVIDLLNDPDIQAKLGPFSGREASLEAWIGSLPAELGELKGAIKSWSELQPAVHGMRSSEMAEDIEKDLPMKMTPETLIGFIKGFNRTARTVSRSESPEGNAETKEALRREAEDSGKTPAATPSGGTSKPGSVKMEVRAMPTKFPVTIVVMDGQRVVGTRDIKNEEKFKQAQEWVKNNHYTIAEPVGAK